MSAATSRHYNALLEQSRRLARTNENLVAKIIRTLENPPENKNGGRDADADQSQGILRHSTSQPF